MIWILLWLAILTGAEEPVWPLEGVIHGGPLAGPSNPSGLPSPSTPVGGLFLVGGSGL